LEEGGESPFYVMRQRSIFPSEKGGSSPRKKKRDLFFKKESASSGGRNAGKKENRKQKRKRKSVSVQLGDLSKGGRGRGQRLEGRIRPFWVAGLGGKKSSRQRWKRDVRLFREKSAFVFRERIRLQKGSLFVGKGRGIFLRRERVTVVSERAAAADVSLGIEGKKPLDATGKSRGMRGNSGKGGKGGGVPEEEKEDSSNRMVVLELREGHRSVIGGKDKVRERGGTSHRKEKASKKGIIRSRKGRKAMIEGKEKN